MEQFKKAIANLYNSVKKLRIAFPNKLFTPDGRMVGDIGEAIAAIDFGVKLDKKIRRHWDGEWVDKNNKSHLVQVKTTQKESTYIKKPPEEGIFLVFKIFNDGNYRVVYNGSIMLVWKNVKDQKNKEKSISVDRLKMLNNDPKSKNKIPKLKNKK